jgi:phosphoribosylformimino-5-aminoimidazole carboxamide ribotide isomerase
MTRSLEIIPGLDLRGGQLVRLVQGDYARETVYDADPAGPARRFVRQGATRLHVVDLDGAREGEVRNEKVIRQILDAAGSVPVQMGGGVRTLERVEALLALGIDRVILGTVALEDPDLLVLAAERFPGRIVLGLDARDGCVSVRGWRETSDERVEDVLARFAGLPLGAVLHTDIGRDGTAAGPNVDATRRLAEASDLPVLASGGVSSTDDLLALARTRVIAGVIVGRALYTGAVDLSEALAEVSAC